MALLKGSGPKKSSLVMTPVDLAQVEALVVLAAVRGAADTLLAMSQTSKDEDERAILLQYVTLKEIRDEIVAELDAIDNAMILVFAHLTNTEISLGE